MAAPALTFARLERRGLGSAETLLAALRDGALPDKERRIGPAMPRFALDTAAAEDLLDYLRDPRPIDAPGVALDTVRVGILLPEAVDDAAAELEAWADRVNAAGGLWGRRLALGRLPATAAALDEALDRMPVIAVVAPWLQPDTAAVLEARSVLMLAPLSPIVEAAGGLAVSLGPTLADTASALALALRERVAGRARLPVVLPADAKRPVLLAAVEAALGGDGAPDVVPVEPASLDVRVADGAGAVMVLSPPGRADALTGLAGTTLVAGPADVLAGLVSRPGATGVWLLADGRPPVAGGAGGVRRHLLAAAAITTKGIERAGRRLTRYTLEAGIAAAPIDLGGLSLDYARFPGRGSSLVRILEVEPAAGRFRQLPSITAAER